MFFIFPFEGKDLTMEIDFARISEQKKLFSLAKSFLKSNYIDKIHRTNDVSSYRFDTCVHA